MHVRILALMILCLAAPLAAQQPVPLTRGRAVEGELARSDTNRFALALGARQFVYGEVDQRTVDAVVTIFAPDGRRLGSFDGPARGPEPFNFRTTEAGTYRIEVTPFEQEAGRYAIAILRAERMATTPAGQVDQIMAPWADPDGPGGVVAVTRSGQVIFSRGYGRADVEVGIANAPATIYHMASVSKQFTAFAIAMLADQGRLSLDDDVRRHLPEFPDFGRTITLRHLLNHTSGLRDQWELWAMGGGLLDDVIRQQDLMRLITRQRELNFEPGAEYLYSNSGFTVLAEVVARVGGRPFPDWMREQVFAPLGMANTQIYDDHTRLVPGRAYSYRAEADGLHKAVLSYGNMGATSLFSTAPDLARWLRNWHTGEVGGPRVLAMMQQRGVLNGGDTLGYALGIGVGRRRGLPVLSHDGADAGYRTSLTWFPTLDAGVIVLGNAAHFDANGIARQVAEAFFAGDMAPDTSRPAASAAPAPDPARAVPWTPDAAALAAYAGRYFSDELETQYTLVLVGGRLVARHRRHGDIPLTPAQPDVFTAGEWYFRRLRVERDAAQAVTGFRLTGSRVRNLLFRRVP